MNPLFLSSFLSKLVYLGTPKTILWGPLQPFGNQAVGLRLKAFLFNKMQVGSVGTALKIQGYIANFYCFETDVFVLGISRYDSDSLRRGVVTMDGVTWDVIVVGAGVVGSATAYHLAKQGFKTLLIEQVARKYAKISS